MRHQGVTGAVVSIIVLVLALQIMVAEIWPWRHYIAAAILIFAIVSVIMYAKRRRY